MQYAARCSPTSSIKKKNRNNKANTKQNKQINKQTMKANKGFRIN